MLKSKRNLLAALTVALLVAGCKETEEVIDPIDPPVPEALVLESNIKTKTILENRIDNPNLPDYLVTGNVTVNAELEIKPGVVIAFARDTRLEVNDGGGILIAKGTSTNPIRFIGTERSKGFWGGVQFRSGSSANVLDNVHILHAGSRPLTNTTKAAMAVFGGSKANIAITNCLFEQSGGYGLYVEAGAVLTGFEKNTFKGNTEAGILLDAENVKNLDYNSVFTNDNGRNVVEISSSAMRKNLTAEAVWKGFADKTPYRILEQLSVEANWKLNPGVTIELSRGARITLDDGYLSARGTAASRITIRGVESTPGYWRGLICFSTSEMNVFEYADISGGGSTALVSGKKTNIAVYGSQARMTIKNSKISNSAGYGVFVNYQASVNDDIETVNVFEGNVQGKLLKE